jgi:hypothetical protein
MFKNLLHRKNIIVLLTNKLNDLDVYLAILLEIKARYENLNFILVFYSEEQLAQVKRNYTLWEAVEFLKCKIMVLRHDNKFKVFARTMNLLKEILLSQNLCLKRAPTLPKHQLLERSIKLFSKTCILKTSFLPFTLQGRANMRTQNSFIQERLGTPLSINRLFEGSYDYFLSDVSETDFKKLYGFQCPKDKIIETGYVHRMPEWNAFIQKAVARSPIANGEPYFLYILSCTDRRLHFLNEEPRIIDMVEESLRVLKKYDNVIKTVFKPHIVTDVNAIRGVLKKLEYKNYVIDYGHPMVLASKAKFVFFNLFSTTMSDAYYMGAKTIEYSCVAPELFARLNNYSIGGNICNYHIYRDKNKLEQVLNQVMEDVTPARRDQKFIDENFPKTPETFYQFLDKVLK